MPGIGDAWGTADELMHPRGPDGRWIKKLTSFGGRTRRAGMRGSALTRTLRALASFRPRTFGSNNQAAQYNLNRANAHSARMSQPDYARLSVDWDNANEDLVDGIPDEPSTKKFVQMMETHMQQTEVDLIATQILPPEAFGFTAATMNGTDGANPGIRGMAGRLVASRGYSDVSLGDGLAQGPGQVTLTLAVPKGTRVAIPGRGQTDREMIMDRDTPVRITKVKPDGRGGFQMLGIVEPKRAGQIPEAISGPRGAGRGADREGDVSKAAERVARREGVVPDTEIEAAEAARTAPASDAGGAPAPAEAAPAAPAAPGTPIPDNNQATPQQPLPDGTQPRQEPVISEGVGGQPGADTVQDPDVPMETPAGDTPATDTEPVAAPEPVAPTPTPAPPPEDADVQKQRLRREAKERYRDIARAMPIAEALQSIDELREKKASNDVIAEHIEGILSSPVMDEVPRESVGIRGDLEQMAKDYRAGKPNLAKARMTRAQKNQNLTMKDKAGSVVDFDEATMDPVGDIPEDGKVQIIKPAVTMRDMITGRDVLLRRAETTVPTPGEMRKAARKKAAAPAVPAPVSDEDDGGIAAERQRRDAATPKAVAPAPEAAVAGRGEPMRVIARDIKAGDQIVIPEYDNSGRRARRTGESYVTVGRVEKRELGRPNSGYQLYDTNGEKIRVVSNNEKTNILRGKEQEAAPADFDEPTQEPPAKKSVEERVAEAILDRLPENVRKEVEAGLPKAAPAKKVAPAESRTEQLARLAGVAKRARTAAGGGESAVAEVLRDVKGAELRDLAHELNVPLPTTARTVTSRKAFLAETLASHHRRTRGGVEGTPKAPESKSAELDEASKPRDLDKMLKAELLAHAKENGVDVRPSWTKPKILEAIRAKESGATEAPKEPGFVELEVARLQKVKATQTGPRAAETGRAIKKLQARKAAPPAADDPFEGRSTVDIRAAGNLLGVDFPRDLHSREELMQHVQENLGDRTPDDIRKALADVDARKKPTAPAKKAAPKKALSVDAEKAEVAAAGQEALDFLEQNPDAKAMAQETGMGASPYELLSDIASGKHDADAARFIMGSLATRYGRSEGGAEYENTKAKMREAFAKIDNRLDELPVRTIGGRKVAAPKKAAPAKKATSQVGIVDKSGNFTPLGDIDPDIAENLRKTTIKEIRESAKAEGFTLKGRTKPELISDYLTQKARKQITDEAVGETLARKAAPVKAAAPDPEIAATRARNRQADIDGARKRGDWYAQLSELLNNQAEPDVMEHRIRQGADRLGLTNMERERYLTAAREGKLSELIRDDAANNGIRIDGAAGNLSSYDPAKHQPFGGESIERGSTVEIIRPGTEYMRDGETIRLSKAQVVSGDATTRETEDEDFRRALQEEVNAGDFDEVAPPTSVPPAPAKKAAAPRATAGGIPTPDELRAMGSVEEAEAALAPLLGVELKGIAARMNLPVKGLSKEDTKKAIIRLAVQSRPEDLGEKTAPPDVVEATPSVPEVEAASPTAMGGKIAANMDEVMGQTETAMASAADRATADTILRGLLTDELKQLARNRGVDLKGKMRSKESMRNAILDADPKFSAPKGPGAAPRKAARKELTPEPVPRLPAPTPLTTSKALTFPRNEEKGYGLARPARPGLEDEALYLPNGGADQGRMHLDSDFGALWQTLVLQSREQNSFVNKVAKLGDKFSYDKNGITLDEALQELTTLRDMAQTEAARDRITYTLNRLNYPEVPPVQLPEGTPPTMRTLVERLRNSPIGRRPLEEIQGGEMDTASLLDRVVDAINRIAAGDPPPRETIRRLFESNYRPFHESVDGAFEIWRAFDELEPKATINGKPNPAYRQFRQFLRGVVTQPVPMSSRPRPRTTAGSEDYQRRAGELAAMVDVAPTSTRKLNGGSSVTSRQERGGKTVIHKDADPRDQDAEEVSALMGDALGLEHPAIQRINDRELLMEFVEGQTGGEHLWGIIDQTEAVIEERRLFATPEAKLVGLLDLLTNNGDRVGGNYMVRNNKIVPIDNGFAFTAGMEGMGRASVFGAKVNASDFTPQQLAAFGIALQALEPEFVRLGHLDWFEQMMERFERFKGTS